LATPLDQKVDLGINRLLFRRALKGFLPEEILCQKKSEILTYPADLHHRLMDYYAVVDFLDQASQKEEFHFLDFDKISFLWNNVKKASMSNQGIKNYQLGWGKTWHILQLLNLPDIMYQDKISWPREIKK